MSDIEGNLIAQNNPNQGGGEIWHICLDLDNPILSLNLVDRIFQIKVEFCEYQYTDMIFGFGGKGLLVAYRAIFDQQSADFSFCFTLKRF